MLCLFFIKKWVYTVNPLRVSLTQGLNLHKIVILRNEELSLERSEKYIYQYAQSVNRSFTPFRMTKPVY
ncbi:hypothetical protein SAMN05428975_0069 [Mucilaginibacter sp. OK268]|nr:hypothetical protein SAMN05428975_0069 [Mucilaginibacter sp. OK268]